MRILLVDAQPDSRCAIARWLDEFFGHVQMESAASGAEALKAVEKESRIWCSQRIPCRYWTASSSAGAAQSSRGRRRDLELRRRIRRAMQSGGRRSLPGETSPPGAV